MGKNFLKQHQKGMVLMDFKIQILTFHLQLLLFQCFK